MAGADGNSTAAEAARRMRARADAIKNLEPVYEVFGEWLVSNTKRAFLNSTTFDGAELKRLAESTVEARIARHGGKKTSGKTGLLTAKAAKLQKAFRNPGGIKPLIDSERAMGSVNFKPGKTSGIFGAVGYLLPHITGGKNDRPPQRNVTGFDVHDEELILHPVAVSKLRALINAHLDAAVR